MAGRLQGQGLSRLSKMCRLSAGLGLGDDYGFEEDDMGLGALLKELEAPLDDKPNPRR